MSDGTSLTFNEINSWNVLCHKNITEWETKMIKNLSNVFANQYSKRKIDEEAPYISRPETKKEAAARIKKQLRG